jgi:hypothetical protein
MRISILGIPARNGQVSHGMLHTTRSSTSTISPIAPDASSARSARTTGAWRSWKLTAPRIPRLASASRSSVASASVLPKGFWISTVEPAGSASIVRASACGGSAMSNTP